MNSCPNCKRNNAKKNHFCCACGHKLKNWHRPQGSFEISIKYICVCNEEISIESLNSKRVFNSHGLFSQRAGGQIRCHSCGVTYVIQTTSQCISNRSKG